MPFPRLNVFAQFIATPGSSNVLGYGYDFRKQTIRVWFHDESIYDYYNRPWTVWRDFRAAKSKGAFVHSRLTRGRDYRRVQ